MRTDNKQRIFFIIAIAILLLGFSNGLRFTLPFDVINPYEYFYGAERTNFQIINMFLSGASVTLIAVSAGYLLTAFKDYPIVDIITTLIVMLFISLLSVVFFFGFDVLPGIILMLVIAAFFIRADRKIVLASFIFLFILHVAFNGILIVLSGMNSPGDIIYSSIQEVNRFSSIFGNSDYFAIIGLNIEVFFTYQSSEWFMWILTILPWVLLGMVLYQFNVDELFKNNTLMMVFVTVALILGGLLIKMMEVISLGSFTAANFAERFGGPLLGTGYFMLLFFIYNILPAKISKILGAAGEKGLTVYISSNFIMMFVSYGIGFNLYGEVSIGTMTFIVAIIFIVLVIIMNVLKHYNIKTLENLSVVNIVNKNIK